VVAVVTRQGTWFPRLLSYSEKKSGGSNAAALFISTLFFAVATRVVDKDKVVAVVTKVAVAAKVRAEATPADPASPAPVTPVFRTPVA
jgi:hypothetical protein